MQKAPVEVELKFPVATLTALRDRLEQLGGNVRGKSIQSDEYLNYPLRDFAAADVALRIRAVQRVAMGGAGEGAVESSGATCRQPNKSDQFWLTFKGPNQDPQAKIRTEIETALVDQRMANQIRATFLGIGFFSVATVTKQRETMKLEWDGTQVEVCLDEVDEVGAFVELERVVLDSAEVESAKASLLGLAEHLQLSGSVRESYLEMLLRRRGQL